MTIGPAEISAYANVYRNLKHRCYLIVPSCREGHIYFAYLREARAYLAWMLAWYAVEYKKGRIMRWKLH